MTTVRTIRERPCLPFWRTVGRAYAAPFMNIGTLMHVSWLWILVLAPVLLKLSWYQAPMLADALTINQTGLEHRLHAPWSQELLNLTIYLIMLPATASIAVAWHRLILNHESPTGIYLRLDRTVWVYAAYLLAMVLLLTVSTNMTRPIEATLGPEVGEDLYAALELTAFTAFLAASFVIGRLSPVLPAIALGQADINLRTVWRATQGNTWRLFWGPIVCFLLLMPSSLLVTKLVPVADRATATIILAANALFSIPVGIVGIGFLSFAYRHFFEDEWQP